MKQKTGMLILAAIFGLIGGAIGGGIFGFLTGTNTATDFFNSKIEQFGGNAVVTTEIRNLVEESATTDVVESAKGSVVSIVITKEFQTRNVFGRIEEDGVTEEVEVGGGTGFVVSEDGLLLTNRHVINDEEAEYTAVFEDGTSYDVEIIDIDRFADIAIVKIDAENLVPLTFGDSDQLKEGEIAIAIGNTLAEYNNTVTKGIISGLERDLGAGYTNLIQTDAAINEGNSGGPLLNIAGEVIGINTAVDRSGEGIGFAVPINEARVALKSVQEYGRIIRAGLGVRYIELDSDIAALNELSYDFGAYIRTGNGQSAIVSGSAAEKAGIQEGDIILEIDGVQVGVESGLAEIVKGYNVGDEVTILLARGEEELTLQLVFEEIPEEVGQRSIPELNNPQPNQELQPRPKPNQEFQLRP